MKKLAANDPETRSAEIVAGNIDQLKRLFPEAFTEGRMDFQVLKQVLGGSEDEREERYGLNWHGKRRARQLALAPSVGTLRPCAEDSLNWDTTQNLMIEGDNLEVLKLLQKSYAGKVKLIYIDPPYNTGKDFVYPDNFQDNIKNYLELTGQVEGGRKISSNTESSGRFHTDWLNMMYPRLRLARSLLRDSGLIFVSIDDQEVQNLRAVMGEIFGEENFVGTIMWRSTKSVTNTALISASHTYNVIFAKHKDYFIENRHHFRLPETGEGFSNPDNDIRGPWKADPFQVGGVRPNQLYAITNPKTGRVYKPKDGSSWKNDFDKFKELVADNRIVFGVAGDAGPQRKRFQSEAEERGKVADTWWDEVDSNTNATRELEDLMGARKAFDNPKPVDLVRRFLQLGVHDPSDAIVLDFFAGSGTTGHAVMAQNAADGGSRRYILVQLPEPLDPDNKEQKTAGEFCDKLKKPRQIAELTKERLRRAAKKIKDENRMFAGDLGFRVFKLDSSNIRAWEPDRDNLPKTLLDAVEHLKAGRAEADILYELLLKLGLDLCVPIEQKTIVGKAVHSIGGGVLLACLAERITRDEVEPLAQGIVAWNKAVAPAGDTTCVFRDSAFADDVAKTNLAAILSQQGLATVRSL